MRSDDKFCPLLLKDGGGVCNSNCAWWLDTYDVDGLSDKNVEACAITVIAIALFGIKYKMEKK